MPAETVVPAGARFALAPYRERTVAPTRRGLGEESRSYHLGRGLAVLAWPAAPDVLAVEREGRLLGWTESGVITTAPGAGAVLIDGRLVVDADDVEALMPVSLPTMLVAFARYSRDGSFAVLGANLLHRRDGRRIGGRSRAGRAPSRGVPDVVLIPVLAVILLISAVKLARHD